ncbi:MAG: hypothetical protein GX234_00160 [Clostridiales bacterium]|nr:hypothetical protein [Clostridiales bacterium]
MTKITKTGKQKKQNTSIRGEIISHVLRLIVIAELLLGIAGIGMNVLSTNNILEDAM